MTLLLFDLRLKGFQHLYEVCHKIVLFFYNMSLSLYLLNPIEMRAYGLLIWYLQLKSLNVYGNLNPYRFGKAEIFICIINLDKYIDMASYELGKFFMLMNRPYF